VVHLGVASRDRAVADIAAALVLFSSLLLRLHLPAALLLGPLIAGLILSLRGVKLSILAPVIWRRRPLSAA
jgi:uncharacterized membrane protein AbrB (regulator of aidB expression)